MFDIHNHIGNNPLINRNKEKQMKYLVWKEQSSKRWVITAAESYNDLKEGLGENRPEWFATKREALIFLKDKFSKEIDLADRKYIEHPSAWYYSRGGRPHPFNWLTNKTYLEGTK